MYSHRVMNVPRIDEIVSEAKKIRRALELCDRETTPLINIDFPMMSCKLASLVFSYHALKKWPSITVHGVYGVASDHCGNDTISHYWIEIQGVSVDITADQYNFIDENELNPEIIFCRPFSSVSIGCVGGLSNYNIFKICGRDTYVDGFPELGEDFLEQLHYCYEALGGAALYT